MIIEQLPSFIVSLHFKFNDFSQQLDQDIQTKTKSFKIDESSCADGIKEYCWEFPTWDEAVNAIESLQEFAKNPNLQFLHARARYDDSIDPIVYRDDYRPHRVNR